VILRVGDVYIHNRTEFQQAIQYRGDMSIFVDRGGRLIQFYLGV